MVQVIAEIGSNWDPENWQASIGQAITFAKDAGADLVKFQDWHPIEDMPRPAEWKDRCRPWTLNQGMIDAICSMADQANIPAFFSVFTVRAVKWIARDVSQDWDIPFIKLASSEAANDDLLREIVSWNMSTPVMVSFGETGNRWRRFLTMATLNPFSEVIPFLCVAKYPTLPAIALAELQFLPELKGLVKRVGWSSHVAYPEAIEVAQRAVKKGANFIEVHMRAGSTPAHCPDNGPWALYPEQLAELVRAVKEEAGQ